MKPDLKKLNTEYWSKITDKQLLEGINKVSKVYIDYMRRLKERESNIDLIDELLSVYTRLTSARLSRRPNEDWDIIPVIEMPRNKIVLDILIQVGIIELDIVDEC